MARPPAHELKTTVGLGSVYIGLPVLYDLPLVIKFQDLYVSTV